METNNLTPDVNLKNRFTINEKDVSVNTYDTVEAPGISFGDSFVPPHFNSEEEFVETGAIVVYCILGVFIMAVVITACWLL